MNCHRARQLISPYLDQRLTGREMLALQQHFDECATCECERHSIRQVKMLLRALHEPRPRADLPGALSARLSAPEQPLWRAVSLTALPAWGARPQRGRRLATAMALSCVTVFSFAAACFAPAPSSGALSSSAFLPLEGPPAERPMSVSEASLVPLSDVPRPEFLSLTGADTRHGRAFTAQYEAQPDLRLSPLLEAGGAVPDYMRDYSPGQVTFAGYQTH